MRAALGLLTVLPVAAPTAGVERRMLLAFPAVGLVVGAAWSATAWLAGHGLSLLAVAALVVAVDLAITGALHLDAVGDIGDGYAARRAGAEVAVALDDPRLGAVGAATLGVVLLVRLGLLIALVGAPLATALWLVPVIGRAGMALALWTSARRGSTREGSLAGGLATAATGAVVAAVVAATAALAGVAVVAGASPAHVAVAVAAGLTTALLCTRQTLADLGRPGGDLVGAAGVAAETVALLALAWRG